MPILWGVSGIYANEVIRVAKECINCGKKVGIVSGDHLDGLLCDKCYNEFGGVTLLNLDTEDNPGKFIEYYDKIANCIDEKANSGTDRERIKREFYKQIASQYRRVTGLELDVQEYLQREKVKKERERNAKERELKRVDYAKSFNEFYEYDVVTIINEDRSTIDKEKMMKILSDHAKNGWRLHTIYSNELGKNTLNLLGVGVNSTASEDVLIFERRIPDLDE